MDDITRAHFGDKIELELRRSSEQLYEDLFTKIMISLYHEDFQAIKAAGREGDWKSDGYMSLQKCVYQSYAPSSGFVKSKLSTKIEKDLRGAANKWGDKINKWCFVHNEWEGLPPYAVNLVEDLKAEFKNLEIVVWGPQIIKAKALKLHKHKLVDLFGVAISKADIKSLTPESVRSVLRAIETTNSATNIPIKPVPVDKLKFNKLSDDKTVLLKAGWFNERLVADLIENWPDPMFGEQLADSFRQKYQTLKKEGVKPNPIFDHLKAFTGGNSHNSSTQVAALSVLGYFFERCDIFENIKSTTI